MEKFIVTEKAMRPVSTARKCFYCDQPIGTYHKADCVLINKKVKVIASIKYEIKVPAFWDAEQIEFHRNESSWCASNVIEELQELENNLNKEHNCMCSCTSFKFVEDTSEPFLDE